MLPQNGKIFKTKKLITVLIFILKIHFTQKQNNTKSKGKATANDKGGLFTFHVVKNYM